MVFEKSKVADLKKELDSASNIVVIGHKSPDGDAVGSCLALSQILRSISNANVKVIVPDLYPDFLNWMEDIDSIIVAERKLDTTKALLSGADIIYTLDFNHPSRVGKQLEEVLASSSATKVMIDHHRDPDDYCDYTFSDITACSTAEMVYYYIEAMSALNYITQAVAEELYCGIMTDTGSFKFASTSPGTHVIAAELMKAGCDHEKVHSLVYDANSVERIKLLGYALNKMDVKPEYKIAFIHLNMEELKQFNAKKGDTEGFVNFALSMEGIEMAVFAKQAEEGVKMSFRSKGDWWVNELAGEHFNGGGHKNAAGGISYLSIEDTLRKLDELLPKLVKYNHA